MFNDKKILVLGLGVTGKSAIKCLCKFSCKLYAYDENKDIKIEKIDEDFILFNIKDLKDIDLIVKSPGIYPDHEILIRARKLGIEIISDLELFYRISKCKNIITITGTNGKTTTTSLVSDILRRVGTTYTVGNIGKGVLDAVDAKEDDFVVIEASSFQLEDTKTFKPKIALITYVTKDHLDWHKTEKNYTLAKFKIFKNQDKNDFTVLNFDDKKLKELRDLKSNVYYFSTEETNIKGTYLLDDKIYFKDYNNEFIIDIKDIKILGLHNVKNTMAAITIAKILGIKNEIINSSIKSFSGVEHRIEFVKEINNVKFYNDSKGTNPDSTMVAIAAMDSNVILIAGGYNKGSDFDEMLRDSKDKIKHLILLGETADIIANNAKKYNLDTYIVEDLNKAVNLAYNLAQKNDNILLSPACASWDMYSSYEQRGDHFKKLVRELR